MEVIFTTLSYEDYIYRRGIHSEKGFSHQEKLTVLLEFACSNSEEATLDFMLELFPQLYAKSDQRGHGPNAIQNKTEIPSVAPYMWIDSKKPGETPPAFISRVYGDWLGKGLNRANVRALDPKLGQALDNWLRKNQMPADLDLPTAKERTTREIDAVRAKAIDGNLNEVLGSFTAREAGRIRSNIARHESRKK